MTRFDKRAIAALVLGILSLLFWLIPLFGFPISIVGVILGALGMKSQERKLAVAGLVMSIIGLVACIVNAAIGAFMGANGMLF